VRPHVEVVADAKRALKAMIPHAQSPNGTRSAWLTQIDRWREEHPLRYQRSNGHLQPQDVLIEMYRRCQSEAIVLADVGQNQIWAALWFNYAKPGLFINSGGTGTMGYAFPASIGAKFANPDRAVFCVTGEGGFVMNMQELATCVEHNVDVKIVILNNYCLGMVRQFQDDFYDGVQSQVDLHVGPDFLKLAGAFGMKGLTCSRAEDVPAMFDEAMAHRGPVLMNFDIDPNANVYPIVPLGMGMLDFVEAH
jgi:acetolactate synthase-1/2/3 large subunit